MPTAGAAKARRHRGCMIGMIVGGLIAFLIWLFVLVPGVTTPRFSARLTACRNQIKQIQLALHNYHDTYGSFPPAVVHGPDGKPWHSWRVLILPFLERAELYKRYRFDEPWNGPHNQSLLKEFPTLWEFSCPSDELTKNASCSYFAVIGERTMWPQSDVVRYEDVKDNPSETLHVVEVSDSGVYWMEPRDLHLDPIQLQMDSKEGVGIRSRHGPTGWYWKLYYDALPPHAANVDGSIHRFEKQVLPDEVRSLLVIDDDVQPER